MQIILYESCKAFAEVIWMLLQQKVEKFYLHFHQAMERAGKKFVGEHDFRNFCKMDAANVHNYRRCIMSFDISPCDVRLALLSDF